MISSGSVGIIGGSDGPTAIIVTGGFPWELLILAVIVLGAVLLLCRKKK